MDDDLRAKVRQLEADLKQAAEIGNALLAKNGHLEEELEDTHKRYVATVEKLEQELHSTRMKLECSMETEKCLSADLEHARDQLAKSKKESLACQVALKKLQAAHDESDRTLSDQAFMAEKEKLQKQIRRLEEQLCESRQMNERLLSHNTSSTASSPDALDSSRAACEQEMQLVVGQLHNEIAELKAEKEAALQHLGEAEERLKATLNDLSAQKALFQKQEDECGELRAQLESLQMDQLDPKRRGNSLFSEVEDRRLKQEQELLSLRTRYRALQEKERFLREEVRRTRNQMALILATGSVNKADARQLRLLQESLTCANAEISRLTSALARQTNEQASLDNMLLDGNPLAGLLKMERQRVKELEKERAALLKSISERQVREDRLLRETYEAAQKAEASEARLLKAMVRKSEEQPSSAGFEPRKEVYENLGMVEDKPLVLREVIPMQPKAETVATLGSKSADSSAGCGGTESKSCSGARPKVTFEEHSAKENEPDAEPDSKKFKRRGTLLKPLLEVQNTGKVVTEAPECKQQ
ncbi:protein Spindly-A-like [Dermacentor andersoni]|uniref:protein Spindly-A-like n=1 Tax=Dermacentor andersoni TaxID=34620 RepID=UPI003B3BA736